MPEEDIDIKKTTNKILKLLFVLFVCYLTVNIASESIEGQSTSQIENIEESLSEIEIFEQNSQISWTTKRRININTINSTILNTYSSYNSLRRSITQSESLKLLKILFHEEDIIHLYCVLLI